MSENKKRFILARLLDHMGIDYSGYPTVGSGAKKRVVLTTEQAKQLLGDPPARR
jgi:hypothetical protein